MPIAGMPGFSIGPRAGWANTAHSEQFVKVHYPFHPYYGQELAVVRAKKDKLIFVKTPNGDIQGIPQWMTDESVCRNLQFSSFPCCSHQALLRVVDLIQAFNARHSDG